MDKTYALVDMPIPYGCPCVLAQDNNGWFAPCFAYQGIPEREKEFDECCEKGTKPDWCPIIHEIRVNINFCGYVNDDVDK